MLAMVANARAWTLLAVVRHATMSAGISAFARPAVAVADAMDAEPGYATFHAATLAMLAFPGSTTLNAVPRELAVRAVRLRPTAPRLLNRFRRGHQKAVFI
jgi:hypothetical protein